MLASVPRAFPPAVGGIVSMVSACLAAASVVVAAVWVHLVQGLADDYWNQFYPKPFVAAPTIVPAEPSLPPMDASRLG